MITSRTTLMVLFLLASACKKAPIHQGTASWYGKAFRGKPTASGDIFRPSKKTAAHKTLPFGTVLKVTNTGNSKSVRVLVNDRGPFVAGRDLDLSKRAAKKLDFIDQGTASVSYKIKGCRRHDDCRR